jgi:hypothetical protein
MAPQLQIIVTSAPEGQLERENKRHGKENLEEVQEAGIDQAALEIEVRGELEGI